MVETVTEYLLTWARVVPLELFTFAGSFIEEVLAPIPSPIVMTVTGSIAAAQEKPMAYLIVLSLIGAAGKTIGAVIVYAVADKAEDLIFGKLGKYLGVSHAEVETFGKRIKGTWKDYVLLFFLRALPIMSSAVVSVGAGVIKVPMRVYLPTTILGTIIRDFFYLYVGFTGIETLQRMVNGFESIEGMIEAAVAVAIVLVFGWIYWKRKMHRNDKLSA